MSSGERKGGISSCSDTFDVAKIAKGKIQRLMTSLSWLALMIDYATLTDNFQFYLYTKNNS